MLPFPDRFADHSRRLPVQTWAAALRDGGFLLVPVASFPKGGSPIFLAEARRFCAW